MSSVTFKNIEQLKIGGTAQMIRKGEVMGYIKTDKRGDNLWYSLVGYHGSGFLPMARMDLNELIAAIEEVANELTEAGL